MLASDPAYMTNFSGEEPTLAGKRGKPPIIGVATNFHEAWDKALSLDRVSMTI